MELCLKKIKKKYIQKFKKKIVKIGENRNRNKIFIELFCKKSYK